MDRERLISYIAETFSAEPEYPWAQYPDFAVFRHTGNAKWFALVMDVPKNKLGLPGDERIDIVNVKCDPLLMGSYLGNPGVFPAYHMSKASWLSLALDGSLDNDTIELLLGISFDLTAPKRKNRRKE